MGAFLKTRPDRSLTLAALIGLRLSVG